MSNNEHCAPIRRNNRARFLLCKIESESTRVTPKLRLIVLLIDPFFGVFPGQIGWLSCVLCAYLWRPSVIQMP